jgi:mannose-6-phosphate isomerase-like protein (cupin superfamily)
MPHLKTCLCAAAILAALSGLAASQPAPLPPQGGPGVYKEAGQLAAALAASVKANPGLGISPILVTERYSLLEVRRGAAGPPASHPGWTELHYILDGSGTMITGGKLVAAAGGAPAHIEGGTTQKVKKGDAVVVPPDTPHQYASIDGAVVTLEIRFPDPVLAKP